MSKKVNNSISIKKTSNSLVNAKLRLLGKKIKSKNIYSTILKKHQIL